MNARATPPAVRGLLLAATASLGLGMALLAWKTTAIGSMLFMNHGVAHPTTVLVEQVLGWAWVMAVVALAWSPLRIGAALFLFLSALFLAWANVDQGGYPFSRFAYGAHAMRIAAPLALLLVILPFSAWEKFRRPAVIILLSVATVFTFVIHGLEAIAAHPWFTDLTLGTFRKVGLASVSQLATERILVAVGVVDLAAALLLVAWRHPAVAGWMAFWGLFTAALRPFNYGSGAMGEFIVRLPHFLLPLALLLLFRSRFHSPSALSPQSPGP